ncbi:unnamed protein product [Didymodactylos carnosus]|uniref:Uncharacterized protein n=1 Tax=Didymodactylos carnosus TaxID=1234261 RepID=A0A814HTL6_9BILA|nr:unnamed protein product [Didymodactylos carnosus]CAF1410109.1 unnamed protein product [Didymodactylos carnosus]CAF3785999.1 unnamed protein product [Didymodactylos carnosus]CAF4214454.1 unnamed protein product [Didymodactylos carnosus]
MCLPPWHDTSSTTTSFEPRLYAMLDSSWAEVIETGAKFYLMLTKDSQSQIQSPLGLGIIKPPVVHTEIELKISEHEQREFFREELFLVQMIINDIIELSEENLKLNYHRSTYVHVLHLAQQLKQELIKMNQTSSIKFIKNSVMQQQSIIQSPLSPVKRPNVHPERQIILSFGIQILQTLRLIKPFENLQPKHQ